MAVSDYHEALWESVPEGLEPPYFAARVRFLLEHVPEGARVLDVGCGEGRFTGALVRAGRTAVGIDVAQEPLRRARAREQELDVRLVGATGPWPLEDCGFDAVWAGEVVEHLLDTASWLSEVRRMLRPGGALVLSTPDHGPLTRLALGLGARRFEAHFDPRSDHVRFYTRRALVALLEDFGFQDVRTRKLGGVPGARRVLLVCARRARF